MVGPCTTKFDPAVAKGSESSSRRGPSGEAGWFDPAPGANRDRHFSFWEISMARDGGLSQGQSGKVRMPPEPSPGLWFAERWEPRLYKKWADRVES